MSLKKQLKTLKENWLLVALVLVLLLMSAGNDLAGPTLQTLGMAKSAAFDASYAMEETARMGMPAPSPGYGDFAPEVEERVLTKNANLQTEVREGAFQQAHDQLKSIVKASDSFLLHENVRVIDTERSEYRVGSYSLKVDIKKYDSVITQLKGIGDVQSFTENTDDITGQYTNTKIDLATEQARLARYRSMYDQAERMEDKITLSDRIFEQERRVKYLQDRIENLDKRVVYSTVQVTITEERSELANIVFVKGTQLLANLVQSINSLLIWIVWLAPWALAAWVLRVLYRGMKKRKYI